MTILLTGGTGKTGVPIARRLSAKSSHTVLLASRRGTKPEPVSDHPQVCAVKFDWLDRTTWLNPFDYVASAMLPAIDRIYLVGPMAWNLDVMNEFIDFARKRGVEKFLLLSASQAEAGDPSLGSVHGYLKKLGDEQKVQYKVIRPTWFIENLGEYDLSSIRDNDTICSLWQDGKVPLVSAEDIGDLAYRWLDDWGNSNEEKIICGPELFTNDQVAHLLSEVLGRTITHTRITREEYLKQWSDSGFEEFAQGLVDGESRIAEGSEEAAFLASGTLKGTASLRDYIVKNRHLWVKGSVG